MREANLTSLFYRILFAMASQPICEMVYPPFYKPVRQHMSDMAEHAFARMRTGLLSYEGFLATLALNFGMFLAGKAQNVPGRQWATYSELEKSRLNIERYATISCEYLERLMVGLAGVQTPMLCLRRVAAILRLMSDMLDNEPINRDQIAARAFTCGWETDQLLNELLAVNNIYATTLHAGCAANALVAAAKFVEYAQTR